MQKLLQKLATFFYVLKKSCTSLKYYADVPKSKMSFSLKYFLAFILFLGITTSIAVGISIFKPVSQFSQKFMEEIPKLFPNNTVVKIENGTLSTNQAEPIKIEFPYSLVSNNPDHLGFTQKYLLVIDPNGDINKFSSYDTLMLAVKDKLVLENASNPIAYTDIQGLNNQTIDQNFVNQKLNQIAPYIHALPWLMIGLIILFTCIIQPLVRLAFLFILSILVLAAVKLMKLPFTYMQTFQIGLHAITLPILIQTVMTSFGIIPNIPFFESILFLLFTLLILSDLKKNNQLTKV